jgi:predicted TIM-barrel fold metal-dependent hydrolase
MPRSLHERLGLAVVSDTPVTLIDAHHHLWNLDTHRYPWLQGPTDESYFLGDYSALRRNYLPADYLADSAAHRVLATVHCEAEHDRAGQVEETRWVHEQHARYGFPNAVVAHVWLHEARCEEVLSRHLEYSLLRGIRCKPVTALRPELAASVRGVAGSMQDDNWLRGFSLLAKHGLSWDLRVPYWHLKEAAEVAAAFPQVPIVLNHTGFPSDRSEAGLQGWRQGMRALARQPNVWVKVSELGLRDQPWSVEINRGVVRETLQLFGIERCMFASNYPVAGLRIGYDAQVRGFVEMLEGYGSDQREAFFWRNARDFYRIELPEGEI